MNESPIGDLIYGTLAAIAVLFVGGVHILAQTSAPSPSTSNQAALVFLVSASSTSSPSSSLSMSSTNIFSTLIVKPNLLPRVPLKWLHVKPQKTTQAPSGVTAAASTPTAPKVAGSSPAVVGISGSAAANAQANAQASIGPPGSAPTSVVMEALPSDITAQWLLAQTTSSFKQRPDGGYDMIFTAKLGATTLGTWTYGQTNIGGSGSLPPFTASYTCAPTPAIPDLSAIDQNQIFPVHTSYNCSLTLTPTTGANQVQQTEQFSMQTNPGALVASIPSAMGTVMVNGENNGGLTLNNEDNAPVTITQLTLNVSFAGLSTSDGPLVLRLLDPVTQTSIGDFHMEGFSLAPGATSTYAQTITAPVNITIPASAEKLLPFEVLGVHKLSILGLNPTVTVALQSMTTDRTINTQLDNAAFTWSCVVDLDAYNPLNPTGAFAMGNACLQ